MNIDIQPLLNEGGSYALVILIIWLMRGAASKLGDRLFDAETGLVTQWVADQRNFVTSVQKANDENTQAQKDTNKVLADLTAQLSQNTVHMLQVCHLLSKVCQEHLKIDISEEMDHIARKIAQQVPSPESEK